MFCFKIKQTFSEFLATNGTDFQNLFGIYSCAYVIAYLVYVFVICFVEINQEFFSAMHKNIQYRQTFRKNIILFVTSSDPKTDTYTEVNFFPIIILYFLYTLLHYVY